MKINIFVGIVFLVNIIAYTLLIGCSEAVRKDAGEHTMDSVLLLDFSKHKNDEYKITRRYRSGKLIEVVGYKGNVKHGAHIIYNNDGVMEVFTPYINGKLHGIKVDSILVTVYNSNKQVINKYYRREVTKYCNGLPLSP